MRSWYESNASNIPTFEEYVEYWKNKNVKTDWEQSCQTVALAMAQEAFVSAKQEGTFEKILPYTLIDFIKNKDNDINDVSDIKEGDTIENVKCKLISTKYFDKHSAYLVRLEDDKKHLYSYWSNRDTAGLGQDEFIIQSAIVKRIQNGEISLSYPKVITVAKQAAIMQRNQEVSNLQYPDSGTRFKKEQMKVLEIKYDQQNRPSSVIMEDKNGCKYYIFLIKEYEGYASRVIAFPYNVGDIVPITGTVEKKNGRNGIYYTLSRVILP